MENRRLDLGLVDGIRAESFGEPGRRTFRLYVEAGEGHVSMWIEKEQIVMLGSAISDLLRRTPEKPPDDSPEGSASPFAGDLEIHLGALSVGYNITSGSFNLEASEFSSPFDLESLALQASRPQISNLESQIDGIVSASRPRCVLCGTPLSGGPHFCPPSNGHAHLAAGEEPAES